MSWPNHTTSAFIRSFVRLFVCSFVRSFVRSFDRSFVRSFFRSFHAYIHLFNSSSPHFTLRLYKDYNYHMLKLLFLSIKINLATYHLLIYCTSVSFRRVTQEAVTLLVEWHQLCYRVTVHSAGNRSLTMSAGERISSSESSPRNTLLLELLYFDKYFTCSRVQG